MPYTTIGYHCAEDKGTPLEIERDAPFISSRESPFLSKGYYFWEMNLDAAHYFGNKQYGEYRYVICECHLELSKMFDLVCNYNHYLEYIELEKALKTIYKTEDSKYKNKKWPVSLVIKLLRDWDTKQGGGIFEYDSVRATHIDNNELKTRSFVEGRREQINIGYRIMICLFNKSKINLRKVSIVYPPDYV